MRYDQKDGDTRGLTREEADIVLAKMSAMPRSAPIDLTPDQVDELRRHLWWKRELHSPAGLSHLFPGLGKKKV